MRGKLQPEIYMLLRSGWKPKDLIRIGYKKKTVYNYSCRMPMIIINYKNAIKKLKVNPK